MKDISNTITNCVQYTVDCPSRQLDEKVPVLDLKVLVEDGKIVHDFHEKPCASKFVIPYSSAHSRSMKMSVMVEEGLRRLRNVS